MGERDLHPPRLESTPVGRNVSPRKAAPTMAGTAVCRHGLDRKAPLFFEHRKVVIGESERWKKEWMLKTLDSGE
jgi:hypothetical protein